MTKNLLIVAHPNFDNSTYNKALYEGIKDTNNLTIHLLHKNYPINVAKEQDLLLTHKNLILQFPLYWYSSPAILKDWFDQVFTYGFAYGPNGEKLKNKKIQLVITTGGNKEAYSPAGYNKIPVEEYLILFKQTFSLTQSQYMDPFIVQGCVPKENPNAISQEKLKEKILEYKHILGNL